MTSSIPSQWFYIQTKNHPNHVLTVTNSSWQPGARIELRPILVGKKNQLWCFDQGFFVNKQSGCVMSTKSDKVENQNLIQSRRQPHTSSSTIMNQEWQYKDGLLQLSNYPNYYLNTQQVPRMIMITKKDEEEEDVEWELIDELLVKAEKLDL